MLQTHLQGQTATTRTEFPALMSFCPMAIAKSTSWAAWVWRGTIASGLASLALGCGGSETHQVGVPANAAGAAGNTSIAGSASGGTDSATQGGSAGTSSDGGTANIRTSGERSVPLPRVACPESSPADGDSCSSSNGLSCGYGESGVWGCRALMICQSGVWEERRSECPQPPTCPSETPEAGAKCNSGGADTTACAFPGGVLCNCYDCDRLSPQYPGCRQSGTTWLCWQPPADLDCPLVAPNAGEGCDAPQGKECAYGDACGGGITMLCRLGIWEGYGGDCPQ